MSEETTEVERRIDMARAMVRVVNRLNAVLVVLSVSGLGILGAYIYTTLVWQDLSKDRTELARQFYEVQETTLDLSAITKVNATISNQVMNRLEKMTDRLDKVIIKQYEHEYQTQEQIDSSEDEGE